MRFILGTVMTLLVVIDCAVAVCSTFPTQINVSMCSWQGLRGKHSLSIFLFFPFSNRSFFLLTLVANILRDIIYLDGGELWYQKYEVPPGQYLLSLTATEDMTMVALSPRQITVCGTKYMLIFTHS